jgi:hypothetical protein
MLTAPRPISGCVPWRRMLEASSRASRGRVALVTQTSPPRTAMSRGRKPIPSTVLPTPGS